MFDETRRLDHVAVIEHELLLLGRELRPLAQITTLQVDPQRAKTILAPALYDLCCTENRSSVIVL